MPSATNITLEELLAIYEAGKANPAVLQDIARLIQTIQQNGVGGGDDGILLMGG